MTSYSDILAIINATSTRLRGISDEQASIRPAPGAWSPKEIIGHLIDSAANNHQRFLRAISQEELTFPGYDQDAWVTTQDYQSLPWREVLDFWFLFNHHLARVVSRIPEEVRTRPRSRHNLHQIAWKTVPAEEVTTLDILIGDYVNHMMHHLNRLEEFVGATDPIETRGEGNPVLFLALERENPGAQPSEFTPFLAPEARAVLELQQKGLIREIYFREERNLAVIFLVCRDYTEAKSILHSLPLVSAGLIDFEVISLIDYPGFSRLFPNDK